MVEASLVKAKVVYNKKLDPQLIAVFHYDDEALNVKFSFDWETFNRELFLDDLREEVAESFDIATKFVDVRPDDLTLVLMSSYSRYMTKFGSLLH